MNEIIEQINQKIDCCNHIKQNNSYCKYLSEKTGRLFPVSKAFCNLYCRKVGPFDNRELTYEESYKFTSTGIEKNISYVMNKPLIKKILINYSLPISIVVPKIWEDIVKNLEPFKEKIGFKEILLTGSIITSTAKEIPKDLDIVLYFDDLNADIIKTFDKKILPETICNIKTDYFLCFKQKHAPFFTQLSPNEKKVYVSEWYTPNIVSYPDDFEIIYIKYNGYDENLKNLFNEEELKEINQKIKEKLNGIRL